MYNVDLWLLTYEKELADSLGQQPAFEDTVMPKPSGAETKGVASEFEGVGEAPAGGGVDFESTPDEPVPDEGEIPPPV